MADTLEEGRIAFLYRPRVEHPLVNGFKDVQGLSLLLRPDVGPTRRLAIGRKRLPTVRGRAQRFWAFVERVGEEAAQWDLGGYTYDTQRLGERHQGPARLAGEGGYALFRKGATTRLHYWLEVPHQPGEVQLALGIEPEGGYIAALMNPELKRRAGHRGPLAEFPSSLQAGFGERKFAPVDPPAFLDHPGAELVLIAAPPKTERAQLGSPSVRRAEEALRQVGLPTTAAFLRPLLQGAWS